MKQTVRESSGAEVNEEQVAVFQESLKRCLAAGDFVGAFYDRFLSNSEEARLKFVRTDLVQQRKVLASSLYLMARAALGFEDGMDHLDEIARLHNRWRLDIAPHLYAEWLEALLETARECDPKYSGAIERAWRDALAVGINRMIAVYRESQTNPPPAR